MYYIEVSALMINRSWMLKVFSFMNDVQHTTPKREGVTYLTWIIWKYSREGSIQSHVGANFIVLIFLGWKLEYIRPYFVNLVPGVFEIRYTLFM